MSDFVDFLASVGIAVAVIMGPAVCVWYFVYPRPALAHRGFLARVPPAASALQGRLRSLGVTAGALEISLERHVVTVAASSIRTDRRVTFILGMRDARSAACPYEAVGHPAGDLGVARSHADIAGLAAWLRGEDAEKAAPADGHYRLSVLPGGRG